MFPQSVLSTSRSTLIHAALALASPELKLIDAIIHSSHKLVYASSLGKASVLPTEILLMIRANLLPIVTADLMLKSASALSEYELSVQDLLCPDCLWYNFDIYGPDIWQWDQFTGPCACLDIEMIALPPYINAVPHPLRRKHGIIPIPDHKQYTDSQHWLECHLSHEALRICGKQSAKDALSGATSTQAIWALVEEVLHDYGCEIVSDGMKNTPYAEIPSGPPVRFRYPVGPPSLRTPPRSPDVIHIIPSIAELCRCEKELTGQLGSSDEAWLARIILHRLNRGLGLLVEHCSDSAPSKIWMQDTQYSFPLPSRTRHSTMYPRNDEHCDYRMIKPMSPPVTLGLLVNVTADVIIDCLSLPLTFATFAMVLMCYYAYPRSLRILG